MLTLLGDAKSPWRIEPMLQAWETQFTKLALIHKANQVLERAKNSL